jgi:Zn-dependent protease
VDLNTLIPSIATYALPVIFAITIHEAAHGYAAKYFGDNTAWMLGRVSLNPVRHIDPMGTIVIPLLLFFSTSGAFVFGYAKPVPVRFDRLRNPKRDMVWVALAGPASNFVQAFAWMVLFHLCAAANFNEPFVLEMCKAGLSVNVGLCVLNLIPIPPLDGGRILVGLLPMRPAMALASVERWGFFIVMGLLFAGIADSLWMRPMMALTYGILNLLTAPLSFLLH